jgi:hypothetical protein
MVLAEMIVQRGFVAQSSPRTPDQHGYHFGGAEFRMPTAGISGKMFWAQPLLDLHEQVIDQDVELEQ